MTNNGPHSNSARNGGTRGGGRGRSTLRQVRVVATGYKRGKAGQARDLRPMVAGELVSDSVRRFAALLELVVVLAPMVDDWAEGFERGGRTEDGHRDPVGGRRVEGAGLAFDVAALVGGVVDAVELVGRLLFDAQRLAPLSPEVAHVLAVEAKAHKIGAGSCGACGGSVTGVGEDRKRNGYCPSCSKAWDRAGRPDRGVFERMRRARAGDAVGTDESAGCLAEAAGGGIPGANPPDVRPPNECPRCGSSNTHIVPFMRGSMWECQACEALDGNVVRWEVAS